MSENLEGPTPPFHLQRKGARGSKARGHPHPTLKSQKPPSPPLSPPALSKAAIVNVSLREALEDPALLGDAIPRPSWLAWRVLLLAMLGEPLTEEEMGVYRKFTQREVAPSKRVSEFYGIIGRRGGKSRAIAVLICYLSCLIDHRPKLASGEIGISLCISPSQEQSAIILGYCAGILENSPILRQLVKRSTSENIELSNRITISVRSASYRRLRGQTCVCCVADESAFFFNEDSSNPDHEILGAVRPSLATTGGLLAVISSPYSRRGVLWDGFRKHFGPDGNPNILVAKGTSQELNPEITQEFLDAEYEKDPTGFAAEYLAEFRSDIEGFITSEAIAACTDTDVRERPFNRMHRYSAFADPSGGANDSFAFSISHKEGATCVLDVIREFRAPFSPESVVEQICALLREYMIYCVYGDRYAGEWCVEAFRKRGVIYEPSEYTKSQIYQDCLPLINSRTAALLDDATLRRQLTQLERRTTRGGKDSIDHPPRGRDDVANAACGALIYAGKTPGDPNFYRPLPPPPKGWM
jgi:hypothetical protein